jgi:hypothetical protein
MPFIGKKHILIENDKSSIVKFAESTLANFYVCFQDIKIGKHLSTP